MTYPLAELVARVKVVGLDRRPSESEADAFLRALKAELEAIRRDLQR